MLSILITIYNYNLLSVVEELQKQCENCVIDYEIIAQDDASKSVFNIENEKINQIANCKFIELDKNVGLRQNKNLLVESSKFENLLILDGDCKIISSDFIKNYIDKIDDFDGIYGGRIHNEKCPSDNQKLRWKYGKFIEDKITSERQKSKYVSFLFNNTLIKKDFFNSIKFDIRFQKYGHDDTQFSFKLMKNGFKPGHINNPIEHNDIDTNLVYYNKTKGSIENLLELYRSKQIDSNYIKMTRILSKLERLKLNYLIAFFYKIIQKPLKNNLISNNPSLFVYNVFRLGYLCEKSIN